MCVCVCVHTLTTETGKAQMCVQRLWWKTLGAPVCVWICGNLTYLAAFLKSPTAQSFNEKEQT